jgi:molybdopterin converting factor small subunit
VKIKIEVLGLPALSQAIGKQEIELPITGRPVTVQRVIDQMIQAFGSSAERVIRDDDGRLDPTIQIALNGKKFITRDELDTVLKAGDTLTFMLLMAGGAGSSRLLSGFHIHIFFNHCKALARSIVG